MKIGVYNAHWSVCGGGEKHIGAIVEYLSRFHPVDLIGHDDFSVETLQNRLDVRFADCRVLIPADTSDDGIEELSGQYDLWLNCSFRSTARSKAGKSILLVFFPHLGHYLNTFWMRLPITFPAFLGKLLWHKYGFWKSYDAIWANSAYTQDWIRRWWKVGSDILYPAVDTYWQHNSQKKTKMILGVGRFFVGGHNKKQDVLLKAFCDMYDNGLCAGWELHFCGGLSSDSDSMGYFNALVTQAMGYPVYFHPNVQRRELQDLYVKARIFWHATGYGLSERRVPAYFEHFGISTVEAMSAGCIPIVINKAGQCETVEHGVTGYLWDTIDELKSFTAKEMIATTIAEGAVIEAAEKYSAAHFKGSIDRLLSKINNPVNRTIAN